MKKLITLLLIIPFSFTIMGCDLLEGDEKVARTAKEKTYTKEVEVFDLSKERAVLTFTKSGTASSEITAYVSPETSGKITDVEIEVGDTVKKGDTLVVLGDSVAVDIADLQYDTARKTLGLTYESEYLTDLSTDKQVELATLSFELTEESYKNAVLSKSTSQAIYREQLKNSKISLDTAEEAYKTAKENYYDIQDIVEDLEDDIDDLEDDIDDLDDDDTSLPALEAALAQLENSLANTEMQEESARFSMKSAQNGIEQAEIGINLVKENYYAQVDQIDQAIEMTYIQYEMAAKQLESALVSAGQQELAAKMQSVQASSGTEIAEINAELKYIKAPISGTVTQVAAKEGNMTAPGQTLVKIENQNSLSVTTSVNPYEVSLLNEGDIVIVEGDSGNARGEIISISPTADEFSRKIKIEISITSRKNNIIPGSFVKINFSSTAKNKLFIPLNSISGIDGDKKTIKTVDSKNLIKHKKIETGEIIGNYIEVLSGLTGNEKLVKATTAFIQENEKVEIVK